MKRSKQPWQRHRAGLTLVEVVAAATLLAGMTAGILVSYARHHRQIHFAERQLAAVALADGLLDRWHGAGRGVPRDTGGRLSAEWRWRTSTVGRHRVGNTFFDVVRLDLVSRRPSGGEAGPAVSVEVLVPRVEEE